MFTQPTLNLSNGEWEVNKAIPKVVYTTEVYAVSYSFRTVVLTSPLESIKKKEGGERKKAVISVCDSRQLFNKYMYLVGGPAGASTLFPGNKVLPMFKPRSFPQDRLGSTNLSTHYDGER